MHHNVFYLRKCLFNAVMHHLGNLVRLPQRHGTIYLNLNVRINFIAKDPSLKQVNPRHIWILKNAGAQLFFGLLITGMIDHFIHRIFKISYAAFTIKTKITRLAIGSMTGNPILAPTIPTSAPIEENASER